VGAFPDFHLVIEDLIAEGDKVVVRLTESGTMTGSLMGVAPTGKKYTQPAIEIHRLANGKIINLWTVRDILTVGTQTGMFPAME
jgi:predicted ester cyclase